MTTNDDVDLTAAEAAAEVGVKPVTIYRWVSDGALKPIPGTGRPQRFWLADVLAAEASRKDSMRRYTRHGTFA